VPGAGTYDMPRPQEAYVMANFKRKGPKSTRSGCLLCKPHKRQGAKHTHTARENAKRKAADAEIRSVGFQ
jgi:U3 small nucleolar ribonucleoprotein component